MTTEPSSVIGIKLGHPSIHWINVFGLSVSIHLRLVYSTPVITLDLCYRAISNRII